MKSGFIGLGKMGSRMAEKLLNEGHEVVVWNRSIESANELRIKNHELRIARTIEELVRSLETPRIVWIMVPAAAVEEVLTEVRKFVEIGDIVIDGGNSFYKDTENRFDAFEKEGIHFLGIGVSGGVIAFENGYPMMVGGSSLGYETIKIILDSLARPAGGHEYFGTGGAGHFVKMVHNGIEYGMMQSLGEGFEVLENSKYKFDLTKIAKLFQKGTIISGFLIDRASEMLEKDPNLDSFAGVISRSGEGDWTVEVAKEEGVDVSLIGESVDYRKRSETDKKIQNSFTAKMINALRSAFGGHEIKK